MKGHALISEGAPHDGNGNRHMVAWSPATSGEGRAKCECGALSEELPSSSARKRWHKQHKTEVSPVSATIKAADLPDGSVVASADVAWIKTHPTPHAPWRSTKGGYHGDWDVDEPG